MQQIPRTFNSPTEYTLQELGKLLSSNQSSTQLKPQKVRGTNEDGTRPMLEKRFFTYQPFEIAYLFSYIATPNKLIGSKATCMLIGEVDLLAKSVYTTHDKNLFGRPDIFT